MSQPYQDCVERLLLPSKQLLQRMAHDGIDLSKPRPITHLLVGEDKSIGRASKLFAARGFDVIEKANGRLLLGDKTPLSDKWVSQIVPAMCSKATEFGLTYDGWDVDVSNEHGSSQR